MVLYDLATFLIGLVTGIFYAEQVREDLLKVIVTSPVALIVIVLFLYFLRGKARFPIEFFVGFYVGSSVDIGVLKQFGLLAIG